MSIKKYQQERGEESSSPALPQNFTQKNDSLFLLKNNSLITNTQQLKVNILFAVLHTNPTII